MTLQTAKSMASPVLNQLQPFNQHRFDACMNHLMHRYERPFLDQHDIAKLHLMIDFFHVLETGRPAIGGSLERWTWGPVIKQGYNRAKAMGHAFDEQKQPVTRGALRVIGKSSKAYSITTHGKIDPDDFSPAELQAMDLAWQKVMSMNFNERNEFFHSPKHYMGTVWTAAKEDGRPMSWLHLVEAYEAQTGEQKPIAKAMLRMWQDPEG